jgi:hypothetical protein
VSTPDRDAALVEFDASRAAFTGAYDVVPDEALAFCRPEEEYALGGLVPHAVGVLEHYRLILSQVVDAGFGEVRPEDPPGFRERVAAEALAGLQPAERAEAFDNLDRCHEAFVSAVQALGEADWDRKAPVWFGGNEPLPTSPADIWGWLNDHYLEHVPQVAELHKEWEASRTR